MVSAAYESTCAGCAGATLRPAQAATACRALQRSWIRVVSAEVMTLAAGDATANSPDSQRSMTAVVSAEGHSLALVAATIKLLQMLHVVESAATGSSVQVCSLTLVAFAGGTEVNVLDVMAYPGLARYGTAVEVAQHPPLHVRAAIT